MFEYFIAMYADPILRLLLTALGGCLGVFAAKIFRTYINDKTKLTVAKAAVACVQQVWYALDGPGKMDKAMELMAAELARKGVKFDADEMWMYAEAAIAEFKEAFRKPDQAEDTAAAVNARAPGAVRPFEDDDRSTSGLLE
jgi:hypothetical protein